jgi:hypothetical protein
MKNYTAKLIINGIPEMNKNEFDFLVKWLKNKAKELRKEREEYSKHYTATLY